MNCKRIGRKFLRLAALLPLLAATLPATAGDDFGVWTSVAAEKEVTKKLSFEGSLEFRAENKLRSATRWDVSVGADYKLWKFLKVSGGYVYIYDRSLQETKVNFNNSGKENGYNVDHGFWRSKHRAHFDLTFKHKLGRFELSLRERYQFTHYRPADCLRDRYRDEALAGDQGDFYEWNGRKFYSFEQVPEHKSTRNRHYLRSRLQLEYDIKGLPLAPAVSYEMSNDFSDAFDIAKHRVTAGADWKVNKKNVISLNYIYENGADDDSDGNAHVISVGYKLKF